MQREETSTHESWRPLATTGQAANIGTVPRLFLGCGTREVSGVTLLELLCVVAIIGILASLLLPTVVPAYSRVRAMSEEMEAGEIVGLLLAETRGYCARTPKYRFENKKDFEEKCGLAPKCRSWVQASATEFVPFNSFDPTNRVVLVFHIGRNHATRYDFTAGELSTRPPER